MKTKVECKNNKQKLGKHVLLSGVSLLILLSCLYNSYKESNLNFYIGESSRVNSFLGVQNSMYEYPNITFSWDNSLQFVRQTTVSEIGLLPSYSR